MQHYALRRLLAAVPLFFLMTVISFGLMQLAPGGPIATADPRSRAADRARLERALGLDRPLHTQYAHWLGGVLRGDLGRSLVTGEPVGRMIRERLPATLELMGSALVLSLVLGAAAGALGALRRGTGLDHALSALSLLGLSIPVYWLGMIAILVFAARLGWFPAGGRETIGMPFSWLDHLRHLALPSTVLAVVLAPQWSRHLRTSLLEVLGEDWLQAARARGLAPRRLLLHAVRPAFVPIVVLLGVQAPVLFTGAAITETIFAWPGIGRLFYEGAQRFDYTRLMGILLVASVLVVLCNLAADLVSARLDPRIVWRERR